MEANKAECLVVRQRISDLQDFYGLLMLSQSASERPPHTGCLLGAARLATAWRIFLHGEGRDAVRYRYWTANLLVPMRSRKDQGRSFGRGYRNIAVRKNQAAAIIADRFSAYRWHGSHGEPGL